MTSRREDGDEACRGAKGDGRDGGTGPGCLPYRVHVRFRTLVSRVSAAVASRIGIAGVPGGNLAGSGSWARRRRKQAGGGQWQMRRQVVEPSVHTHVTGRITGLGLRRHEYPASSTLARGDFRNK